MKLNFASVLGAVALSSTITAVGTAQSAVPATTPVSVSTAVADVQRSNSAFAPLPSIDNGPRDLIPTELLLCRNLTANFGGQYTQEAAIYLPIYYHAGYLSLSEEDKMELKRMESEFVDLIARAEAFNQEMGAFLERFQALSERGRPRGVIQQAQLLVPYAGESKVKENLDPLRLVRKGGDRPAANAVTGTVSATPITPIGLKPTTSK